MDASLTLAGLISHAESLLDSNDFNGAENFLLSALEGDPRRDRVIHYELGRLYRRWNKLSSAINHFNHAAAMIDSAAADEFFLIKLMQELKGAKQEQSSQRP